MEVCALLLGHGRHIAQLICTANVAAQPQHRFEIDPAALIAAHKSARTGGPQLLGYAHSHPAGAAVPSAADRAGIVAAGELWLILGADDALCAYQTLGVPGGFDFRPVGLSLIDAPSALRP